MDNRKEIAEKIITALTNRSGFNDLWYNLDEEIQTEITDEIVNILPIHNVVGQSEQFKPFKESKGICKKCLRHWCICEK
jgi:hypothetical protein